MKHFFVLTILFTLFGRLPAGAQGTASDTIGGQARFVRIMSASLCAHIAESGRTRPFSQLNPASADSLFTALMATGMSEQADAFSTLLNKAAKRNISGRILGERIGRATIAHMTVACPSAMGLLMRTSWALHQAGPQASSSLNNISADEKANLQPIADSVCARLTAEDVRTPLKSLTPADRKLKMTTIMQTTMVRNMPVMLKLYTPEQLTDQTVMQSFGLKLASMMMTQCPSFLMMLGQDATNEKQDAQQKAKASRKPAPAGKPASRKPSPKKATPR